MRSVIASGHCIRSSFILAGQAWELLHINRSLQLLRVGIAVSFVATSFSIITITIVIICFATRAVVKKR